MEDNRTQNFNSSGYNSQQKSGSSFGVNNGQNISKPNNTNANNKNLQNNQDESLKRLHQQLNQDNDNNKGKRVFKIIMWVVLVLLLVGMAGVGIYFFIQGQGEINLGSSIRLSVNVDERLEGSTEADSITRKQIYPGNSFPVVVEVRNSNNFGGDSESLNVVPIFVRFKVELVIDNQTYNNVVVPTIQQNNWCVYDEDVEQKPWDGYYYYFGRLVNHESVALFTAITFDFANTTNEMAGKDAVINISIEAVEGEGKNIGGSEAWGSAPDEWLNFIYQNFGE